MSFKKVISFSCSLLVSRIINWIARESNYLCYCLNIICQRIWIFF